MIKHITPILQLLCGATTIFMSGASLADDRYSLGVEAFRDHYREPDPAILVDEHANYGAITGNYTHALRNVFGGIDGRASYGSDNYKSVSGTDNGIPQYEFEARVRGGLRFDVNGDTLSTYIGLGSRYFYDKGKNTLTNLGYYGYDRRILQFYVPIGTSYEYNVGNWSFTPTVEIDPLFAGVVNSRLQNGGGYNITNNQHSGYGLRAEFMVGQKLNGYGWQVGPFIRYWKIKDSDTTTDLSGLQWIEPKNDRLQAGADLRILF